MAYQPHSQECRKKFEEVLENEAEVRNQQVRMEDFEERERKKREKKESKKEKEQKKEKKAGEWKAEESRDSGGA
eukprot:4846687-Karenia_brevis.AAC.1